MSSSPQSPEPPDEAGPDAAVPDDAGAGDYDGGVPTFDFVRDRIEGRYATAMGTTELAEDSAAGRSLAQQQEDRDKAARERLEQIRRSMRDE
jgi:phage shock protein A